MKKLLNLIVFTLLAITAHAQTYSYDVNHDGDISVQDVMLIVNKILGDPNPEENSHVYLACPDDHHPHIIDLGLPSGTKWSCCNIGATKTEESGGYYAWGEMEEKDCYNWSTYAHCNGAWYNCHDLGSDIAGTKYDVAHMKWGGAWVMPSYDQIDELYQNCDYETITINGVNGIKFTSSNNSGSIFLPAAGYYDEDGLKDIDSEGQYWTSTRHPSASYHACYFNVTSWNSIGYGNTGYRDYGRMVRPVCDVDTPEPLELSMSSVVMYVGDSATVEITSGCGPYALGCTTTNVVRAAMSGNTINITPVAGGEVVVAVVDIGTGRSQLINVTVIQEM